MATSMIKVYIFVVFLFAIIHCLDSSENVTESISSDRCFMLCENSFAVHTYPEPADLKYCKSGCRFYKLNEFSHENTEVVIESCQKACGERTSLVSQKRACDVGCETQNQISKEEKAQNKTQNIHVLAPLYSIRYTNLVLDTFLNAFRAIQTTWSYYMADTGDVVAMKSSSQYIFPIKDKEKTDEDHENSESSNANEYSGDATFKINVDNLKETEEVTSRPSSDWLGCVSRKSGLPRSFIAFSILMSVVAFVWICLSTSTSDKRQNSEVCLKGKLPIMVNIDENSEKIKIQPIQDDQAPPIPVKIHLTTI